MELLNGGTVSIPLRHIYLYAIVLFCAYFLAREMALRPKREHYAGCQAFLNDAMQKIQELVPKSSKSLKNMFNPNAEEVFDNSMNMLKDGLDNQGETCRMEPSKTGIMYCPECFKSRAKYLSKFVQPVSYSKLKFPRGPKSLFRFRDVKQQSFVENYILTPKMVCRPGRRCPYLLAVQLSVANDGELRDAVRRTWGSVAKTQVWPYAIINAEVQLIFVVAHQKDLGTKRRKTPNNIMSNKRSGSQNGSIIFEELKKEAELHGDILYLDMQDSYFNLTLKLLSALKWVHTHCSSVKFVLKVDSDTFVNVPLLLDLLLLNEQRLSYSVLGKMYTDGRVVHRHDEWAINTTLYPPPTYPVYASGVAYVLSKSAVNDIVITSQYVPMTHVEDAFITGVLGRMLRFQHFEAPSGYFAHMDELDWLPATFVGDRRITGTSLTDATLYHAIWSIFLHQNTSFEESKSKEGAGLSRQFNKRNDRRLEMSWAHIPFKQFKKRKKIVSCEDNE